MKVDTNRKLLDQVTTAIGASGKITHIGVDMAGPVYLIEWQKNDGNIASRWVREAELNQ